MANFSFFIFSVITKTITDNLEVDIKFHSLTKSLRKNLLLHFNSNQFQKILELEL